MPVRTMAEYQIEKVKECFGALMRKTYFSKFLIKFLAPLGLLLIFGFWAISVSLQEEYVSESEYEFQRQYGAILDDFYYVGEEFQARWLTESEDEGSPCVLTKHCLHIKIASVANCVKGAVLKYSVLDGQSNVLSLEESQVFLIKPSEIIQIELGSNLLTKKGFLEPLDAYCKDALPAA